MFSPIFSLQIKCPSIHLLVYQLLSLWRLLSHSPLLHLRCLLFSAYAFHPWFVPSSSICFWYFPSFLLIFLTMPLLTPPVCTFTKLPPNPPLGPFLLSTSFPVLSIFHFHLPQHPYNYVILFILECMSSFPSSSFTIFINSSNCDHLKYSLYSQSTPLSTTFRTSCCIGPCDTKLLVMLESPAMNSQMPCHTLLLCPHPTNLDFLVYQALTCTFTSKPSSLPTGSVFSQVLPPINYIQ